MTLKPYYDSDGIVIYHGDCREILPELDPVDLILTDPPYGMNIEYGSYDDTLEASWELIRWLLTNVANKAGVTVFPVGATDRLPEILALRRPTWYFIWDKGSPGTRCRIGFNDWEICPIWGWRSELPACHDMIRVSPGPFNNSHPCPKPERFATALIKRCSLPNEMVLDPFMGSGTTLRAAKDLGRKAIGIEIERKYVDIAVRRMGQAVFDFEAVNA